MANIVHRLRRDMEEWQLICQMAKTEPRYELGILKYSPRWGSKRVCLMLGLEAGASR